MGISRAKLELTPRFFYWRSMGIWEMHLLCQIREYTSFYLEHFDWQNPLELLFVSSKGNVLVQSHGRSTPFYKTYILPKNWASKLISVSYKVHQLAHNWLAKQAGKFLLSCHLVLFFCIVPLFICYAYVMAKKKKKLIKTQFIRISNTWLAYYGAYYMCKCVTPFFSDILSCPWSPL